MNIETQKQQDRYIWSAIYTDGSIMCEYDKPEGRGFAEVGDKPVKALDIEPLAQDIPAHRVLVPEGATPVFFRRRTVSINLIDESSTPQGTIHCIGWKRSDEDAVYLFVYEDGSCLLSTDLQAA